MFICDISCVCVWMYKYIWLCIFVLSMYICKHMYVYAGICTFICNVGISECIYCACVCMFMYIWVFMCSVNIPDYL